MVIEQAKQVAGQLVAPLGRRWLHVQAVAGRAAALSMVVESDQRDDLIAAAWLHDIGYSPEIAHSRFHPLDGARYLRDLGWPSPIFSLVAHHSGARFEAIERRLSEQLLTEFPFEDSPCLDALAAADLTIGPGGESMSYEQRISEILSRYLPDDPVHRAWLTADPVLAQSVERTYRRMEDAQSR